MTLAALNVTVELTQITCGVCAGVYAIAERVRQYHHEQGTSWNCPYCKTGWGYSGNGSLAEAREALQAEKLRHSATLSRLNVAAAERDKAQRKLQRVKRGVCPECNRSFQDLARHMACKHRKK